MWLADISVVTSGCACVVCVHVYAYTCIVGFSHVVGRHLSCDIRVCMYVYMLCVFCCLVFFNGESKLMIQRHILLETLKNSIKTL